MKKRILITGAGGNAAVGFTKCLLRDSENYLVGTDINFHNLFFAQTHSKYLIPNASCPDYIIAINKIIKKERIDFIHVQPDKEIEVISKNRDQIHTKFNLPSENAIIIAQNKMSTYEVLKSNNVPVPISYLISKKSDVLKIFKIFNYRPVWFRSIKGAGGKGSLLIKDPKIAYAWIDHWSGYNSFMASQYLPGKNIGWDSLWHEGKLIAHFTKERLEYALAGSSPSGISGTAGAIKCIKRNDVKRISKLAILAIDKEPNGLYSVDLKENEKGEPFVTEINPARFLTSSTHFFAATNYNLPLLYIKLAFNEKYKLIIYPEGYHLIRSLDAAPILFKEATINGGIKKFEHQHFLKIK